MNNGNLKQDLPIDDHEIDLLVDGELNEQRRRELLTGLDKTSDGWRRCALAFLEYQCWRQTCGSANADLKSKPTTASLAPARKPGDSKPGDGTQYRRRPGAVAKAAGMLMAMAASFLFALGLGSMIWNADQQGHLGTSGGQQQAGISAAQIATPTNPHDGSLVHDTKVVLPGKYQTVTITDKRPDGTKRSIQLPAVVQNSIDETRLRETPFAIPTELVQSFQKAGHNVRQSRRLVPFRMKDGRRLVVPVDQLDVRYVGKRQNIEITPQKQRPAEFAPKGSLVMPPDSKWQKLGKWFDENRPGVDGRPPLRMRFMHPGIILPPGTKKHPPLPADIN